MENENQVQRKTIQIVDLSSKNVNYSDKRTGQPKILTVYLLKANDGLVYECLDRNFFLKRKIGETLEIQFTVRTNSTAKGIYTSYKIYVPVPNPAAELLSAVLTRIDKIEANIIAAIKTHCGEDIAVGEKKQLSLFDEQGNNPGYSNQFVPKNSRPTYNPEIPVIEENEEIEF